MSNLEALLLGMVQGLTEFLPISSSGHLILVPWLQNYHFLENNEAFNKTFDVALHAGTLVAVVAYFRVELIAMAHGFVRALRRRAILDDDERLACAVAIGTVPAVIAGGVGESFIEDHLGEPWQIAILLIAGGLLLAWADRRPQREGLADVDVRQGLTSASPRPLPSPRASRGRGSRSPPAVSSASIATPRHASRSCSLSRSRPAQSSSRATGRSPTGCPTMWRADDRGHDRRGCVRLPGDRGPARLVRRRSYDIFVSIACSSGCSSWP